MDTSSDSFLCPWGKKAPYIFPKFKPLNTDIELLMWTTDTFFLRNEQILI